MTQKHSINISNVDHEYTDNLVCPIAAMSVKIRMICPILDSKSAKNVGMYSYLHRKYFAISHRLVTQGCLARYIYPVQGGTVKYRRLTPVEDMK